eukprot:360969-Chlamydomonas_euryale.AAC.5
MVKCADQLLVVQDVALGIFQQLQHPAGRDAAKRVQGMGMTKECVITVWTYLHSRPAGSGSIWDVWIFDRSRQLSLELSSMSLFCPTGHHKPPGYHLHAHPQAACHIWSRGGREGSRARSLHAAYSATRHTVRRTCPQAPAAAACRLKSRRPGDPSAPQGRAAPVR